MHGILKRGALAPRFMVGRTVMYSMCTPRHCIVVLLMVVVQMYTCCNSRTHLVHYLVANCIVGAYSRSFLVSLLSVDVIYRCNRLPCPCIHLPNHCNNLKYKSFYCHNHKFQPYELDFFCFLLVHVSCRSCHTYDTMDLDKAYSLFIFQLSLAHL